MTPNDVKIVADNIDDFIEVPDGVARLRKAVLTLAMSGKLVPQIVNEGTADDLFKEIQHELKSKTGVRKKKVSDFMPPNDAEIPFGVPATWKWVRINEIGLVVGGGTPSTNKDGYFTEPKKSDSIPWLSPADMRKQTSMYVSHGRQNLTADGYKNSSATLMPAGTILFSSRAPIGYVGIATNPLSTNQGFKSIVPATGICSEYVYWFLRLRADDINARAPGTTFKEISGVGFAKEIIALPPYLEQKRIADKVQEVMKQLDELEIKKRERDEMRARLARSAMQALGKGESKIAFEQLTELVKTPSDIKELENALLTLAVSGKLTQQNKSDGTSEDLFNQIQSKRVKVKKQVPVGEKDQLFPIPSSWSWVRLEDVFDVRDGTHDSPKYHDNGYPLITSKNLYYGSLDFLNVKYISEDDHKKISERSKVDRDDVLFAMIGSIGNPVIVDTDTEFSIKNVALFKYYDRKLSEPVFLLTYLKYATQNMRAASAGGVQSFVSLGFLRKYPFPLPPLAEQRRIVKKVEEIMDLINRLKKVVG